MLEKQSIDRSFEISGDGTRQSITAEARSVVRPIHQARQRRRTGLDGEVEGPAGGTTVDDSLSGTADSDTHAGDASEGEWDFIEDTVRPEESLDPNGDPVDSEDEGADTGAAGGTWKRKGYASSVCLTVVSLFYVY